jgi:hypothetical protein
MMVQLTTPDPYRAPPLAAGKIKVLNPKSVDDDGEQTEPLNLGG